MQDNYDVSVFIIDNENNYIELEEYKAYKYNNGMFVCLTNDELNSEFSLFNNSICIYKHWQTEVNEAQKELMKYGVKYNKDGRCKWQIRKELIPNNEKYDVCIEWIPNDNERHMYLKQFLDGYLSCQNIMANVPSLLKDDETIQKYIPAIMTAHYTKVKYNGKIYNGYLPSIGQLIYTSKNIDKVNKAFESLEIQKFKIYQIVYYTKDISGNWWSSTQYNAHTVWELEDGDAYYYYSNHNKNYKNNSRQVLPLFAV